MRFVRLIQSIIKIMGSGFFLFSWITVILIMVVVGCSPVHRHKTLAFFFDGVPDPAEAQAARTKDSLEQVIKVKEKQKAPPREELAKSMLHAPYKKRQCSVCHDQNSMGKFIIPQPALCYQCHVDFNKKYKILHDPVVSGNCTACHNAHLSENPKLLTRSNQQICFYCHDQVQVLRNEAHHDIATKSCIDCHDPHGGNGRALLKKLKEN